MPALLEHCSASGQKWDAGNDGAAQLLRSARRLGLGAGGRRFPVPRRLRQRACSQGGFDQVAVSALPQGRAGRFAEHAPRPRGNHCCDSKASVHAGVDRRPIEGFASAVHAIRTGRRADTPGTVIPKAALERAAPGPDPVRARAARGLRLEIGCRQSRRAAAPASSARRFDTTSARTMANGRPTAAFLDGWAATDVLRLRLPRVARRPAENSRRPDAGVEQPFDDWSHSTSASTISVFVEGRSHTRGTHRRSPGYRYRVWIPRWPKPSEDQLVRPLPLLSGWKRCGYAADVSVRGGSDGCSYAARGCARSSPRRGSRRRSA